MVRIQDGSSSWFVESTAVEGKLDCRVPWWVWQVELDGTSVALSVGQNEAGYPSPGPCETSLGRSAIFFVCGSLLFYAMLT